MSTNIAEYIINSAYIMAKLLYKIY